MRRLLVALSFATIGFVAPACGGDDGADADRDGGGPEIVLELEDGQLVGGVRREEVSLGDAVTVRVEGKLVEEVHVHGYDLYIEPDGPMSLEFDALIPGRFEIELEQSGQLLIELTVS